MNPYWWNANHVFIPYCSSDIWSGDSPARPPTMAMSFLGSRIIDEVIGELIRSPMYEFLDSKFILLAGSSAGAAGVMINLDRVAKMISDAGSTADVRGLADSGWIMDMDDHQQMPIGFSANSDKQSSSSPSSC
ncbi:notum-like protein, partial [Euroglyphus maynei]